jgi:ankyrin repeat protein
MKQMQAMRDADAELPDSDYVNDLKYKALVTRMLLAQTWSKQKLLLWLENESTSIRIVGEYTLKSAHRQWLSYVKRHQHAVDDIGSSERAAAAVKILQCKCLMVSDNASQEEVDGEPLIYAAAADSWALDDFQFVIDAGANLEATNKNRETALHAALDNGDVPALQALLTAGADVHRLDKSGNTSVYIAASKGYSACLQSLFSAKADPLIVPRGGPPIIAAASRAHALCIKILITNGSDVNVRNKDGWTALRCAVEQNHLETAGTLIGLNADVNICSTDGRSPVYAAAAAGRAAIVSILVAHGADVNICDRNGVSPVLAAAFSKNLECVELLVNAGASSNSLSVVALHKACEIGDRQAVEALLADGVDVNQCNRTGESPFQIAVELGHSDIVAALLHAGAASPYGNFHDPESMPSTLTCRLHPHTIQKLRSVYSSGRYSCDACSRSGSGWVYHCKVCGWDIHPACALQHAAASD